VVDQAKLSEILGEFARSITSDFSLGAVFDRLTRSVVDALPITGATLTLISDGMVSRVMAASDDSALRFGWLQGEIGVGPASSACAANTVVAVPDLAEGAAFRPYADAAGPMGLAGIFAFPLRSGDGSFGTLDLYRDSTGDLNRADRAAAQTLADVAAAYLLIRRAREDIRTADEFRFRYLHDMLTGLPNRSLLQERLEHAARRAHRSGASVAVVLADLDDFSTVNDEFGRQVGDDLLRAVAHRLVGLVRPGDTVARSFGDEFVFLCEDLHNRSDADLLAQRVRTAFADPFIIGDAQLEVSASVGVAYAGPGQDILEQLLIRAHVAMFQSKSQAGGSPPHIVDLRDQPLDLSVSDRASVLERLAADGD
jgi:diguanylate cyclase (GGDEF)-like protein